MPTGNQGTTEEAENGPTVRVHPAARLPVLGYGRTQAAQTAPSKVSHFQKTFSLSLLPTRFKPKKKNFGHVAGYWPTPKNLLFFVEGGGSCESK